MILLKGLGMLAVAWLLAVVLLGFGCARLPSSGSVPAAERVQEP